MSASPALDNRYDRERRVGVYVVDAEEPRRRATVGLLTSRAELHVLGAHTGSPAVLPLAVRALPHVCVIGSRVRAGNVPDLIAAFEKALPATRCVRVPRALGLDPADLTPAQRERQVGDVVAFVRSILVAAGRAAGDVEDAVRDHFEQSRSLRPRRVWAP